MTTQLLLVQALNGLQFGVLLFLVAAIFAIGAQGWAALPQIVVGARIPSEELGFAVLLGALAFAGGGGGQNLVQANWIRDKGFGMGVYIPRIVSPITGEEVAVPATGSMLRQDEENLRRFRGWWAVANKEQLVTFCRSDSMTGQTVVMDCGRL